MLFERSAAHMAESPHFDSPTVRSKKGAVNGRHIEKM